MTTIVQGLPVHAATATAEAAPPAYTTAPPGPNNRSEHHSTDLLPFIHQIERYSGELAYKLEKSEEAVSHGRNNILIRGDSLAKRIDALRKEMERQRDERCKDTQEVVKRCVSMLKRPDDSFKVYKAVFDMIKDLEGGERAMRKYNAAAKKLAFPGK